MRGILMVTATKRTTKKAAPKPPPVEDIEELDEDDDLEELEEDEAEETAPAKSKKTASAAASITFGVQDLVKLINSTTKTGKTVDARGLRTLIRKMARDGSNRVEREIVAGNRTRYDWTGPKDPEVLKIVKAFEGGELEADKQEKLAALKARKAEQGPKDKKVTGKKKKAAVVVEEDDDEDEDLEDDDDE